MGLKFLIVDTYYSKFIDSFYASHIGLERYSYQKQYHILMDQCFGTSNFYSLNLNKLGHQAEEIIANCEPLQRQWALENSFSLKAGYPIYSALMRKHRWLQKVLLKQVEKVKPDIVYVQDLNWAGSSLWREIKTKVKLIVGQAAYSIPFDKNYSSYDLIVSSLPNIVYRFRKYGLHSDYLKFAFEPNVLPRLSKNYNIINISHIGGYDTVHQERNDFLERLSDRFDIEYWGYGIEYLAVNSPIRRNYRGEAWGLNMYNVRKNSKITLNKHISSVAERFANNMTLYEATGVGTCLVTDLKDNLYELFEPGKEVVAYRNVDECAQIVKYYLEHEEERSAIANAGQQRTLREHTYYHRMQELVEIVRKYL